VQPQVHPFVEIQPTMGIVGLLTIKLIAPDADKPTRCDLAGRDSDAIRTMMM
jgi:hypothetical protein